MSLSLFKAAPYTAALTASLVSLWSQTPAPSFYRVDTVAGQDPLPEGGPATAARIGFPGAMAADAQGNLYYSDTSRNRIRRIATDGTVRTIAGTGLFRPSIDGQPAAETSHFTISALALSSTGELYIADNAACRISRIDPAGVWRFVAGNGTCGFNGDGPARNVQINPGYGLTFDVRGRLLIAETDGGRIRRLNDDGALETIAGTGNVQAFSAEDGTPARQTPISYPMGLAAAADGTLYYVEWGNRRIRRITPGGQVFTVAGDGRFGNDGDGGPANQATFREIRSLVLDAGRNRLVVSDAATNRVRQINLQTGVISVLAGVVLGNQPTLPVGNSFTGETSAAVGAGLARPSNLAVDGAGVVYVADTGNRRIRRVEGNTLRTLAGRWDATADGPAARAEFTGPNHFGFTANGDLIFADYGNGTIRRLAGGNVITLAGLTPDKIPSGNAVSSTGDGGPALAAGFTALNAMAMDAAGRLYVHDNGRLRRVADGNITALSSGALASDIAGPFVMDNPRNRMFAASTRGKVVVADLTAPVPAFRDFAGNGSGTFSGDGGPATAAGFTVIRDIAVDAAGNVWVADLFRLRRITADGVVQTVAGNGTAPPDLIPSTEAAANTPIDARSIALDNAGRVVMAEGWRAGVIRVFDPATNRLCVIAGDGTPGFSGDGVLATSARLGYGWHVRADNAGNIYFRDGDVIRLLRPVQLSRLDSVSGGDQSAPVNTKLANPLTVRVVSSSGPLGGVPVTFAATGNSTLSATRVLTDGTGVARVEVTLGAAAGAVTITATVEGLAPVTFRATATAAVIENPNRPAIRGGSGVATAGAFGGETLISPGTWIEVYGTNLSATTRSWTDSDFRGAQAPTELDGVRVAIGGRAAYVAFISPGQINAQVPDGVAAGAVDVVVTNPNGASEPVRVTAAAASPALLAPPVFRVGGVQYVAALHQDGAFVGREGLIAGAAFRPARAGDVITLYGVGFGATTTPVPAGQVVAAPAALADVGARLGGVDIPMLFGGLAPNAIGLYQFNLQIPTGVTEGDAALVITAGERATRQDLRLTVAR